MNPKITSIEQPYEQSNNIVAVSELIGKLPNICSVDDGVSQAVFVWQKTFWL